MRDSVYVVGTWDTKGPELNYVQHLLAEAGLATTTVDLSTRPHEHPVAVSADSVAAFHPKGVAEILVNDRGRAVAGMALAFEHFLQSRQDVAGVLGLGGSGGTAMITQGMRTLPVGLPKVMVSTMASGNVGPYVGPSDITMMHSVTDVAGLNRISRTIYRNAATALAGMVSGKTAEEDNGLRPSIALSMFGVTTPCVDMITRRLDDRYDCITFHATGTGGQAMEKLADSGLVHGVIDITTTEVCDLLFGGVLPATEDRFGAIARSRIPYLGSCGALDMVNFGAMETVPEKYRDRTLYPHNPQITLMRTTAQENSQMGEWIGRKLNACDGPVLFLLPEAGISALDAPDMAFHDPDADEALFSALEATVRLSDRRRLVRCPHHINDPEFADVATSRFLELVREV